MRQMLTQMLAQTNKFSSECRCAKCKIELFFPVKTSPLSLNRKAVMISALHERMGIPHLCKVSQQSDALDSFAQTHLISKNAIDTLQKKNILFTLPLFSL